LLNSLSSPVRRNRSQWTAIGLFALVPLLALAGGLGLAPLAALAGLVALPGPAGWRRGLAPNAPLALAVLFLAWASLAQAWSPSDADQIVQVWGGAILYGAFVLACANMVESRRDWPRMAALASVAVLGALLLIELSTGMLLTRTVNGLSPDDPALARGVGRGASVYAVMAGPAAALALAYAPSGRWLAAALALAGIPITLSFGQAANFAAFIAAAAAFGVAVLRPRTAVYATGLGAALWIVSAPAAVTALEPVGESLRASLAFSWEWRWETWSYARDLIIEKPFLGWGMDAARTFDETVRMRGFEIERMPLHPHSAAMQLWLELGMVGAFLGAAALTGIVAAGLGRPLPRAQAAGAAAAIAAMAMLSFVSYGVWQEWWWATGFIAAASVVLIGEGRESA